MTAWSTPDSLRARLQRRWDSGELLTRHARGEHFQPIDLRIAGPTATELGERYTDIDRWVREWTRHVGPYSLSTKVIGANRTGANTVPERVRIDTFEDLTSFLSTTDQVRRHSQLLAMARPVSMLLHDWVVANPIRALAHADVFTRLLACVHWLTENSDRHRYLREVDAPGVDTKFIEQHRAILRELLDQVLGAPVNPAAPDFAQRYGFRNKPSRVRIRVLDESITPWPAGISDVELPVQQLAANPLDADRVFLVENEVTCLAFPPVPRSVLIFGGGYAVSRVGDLNWLRTTDLLYWGDIDTHGFRILNLVRARFPHTRSILMDRGTLLDHEMHWDRESSPVNVDLPHLTEADAALYRDLVEDALGPAVRLEQERISFAAVEAAVRFVESEPR